MTWSILRTISALLAMTFFAGCEPAGKPTPAGGRGTSSLRNDLPVLKMTAA